MSTIEAPNNAKDTALRAKWDLKKVSTKIAASGAGKAPIGLISVPQNAVIYDSNTKKWVSNTEYKVADGKASYVAAPSLKAYSQATTTYLYGKWHSGQPVTIADLMYATAFQYDWATKDGDADKNYDEGFAAQYQSSLAVSKGVVLNKDGSFTSYYNFNWPMDTDRVAANGLMTPKAGNPGRGTLVSWEITEALAKLVTEGSKSGTVYTFSSDASMMWKGQFIGFT